MTTTTDNETTSNLVAAEAIALAGDLTESEREAIRDYADSLCQHGSDVSAVAEAAVFDDYHQMNKEHGGREAKLEIFRNLQLLIDWAEFWDDLRMALYFNPANEAIAPGVDAVTFLETERNRLDATRAKIHASAFAYLLRSVREAR